MQSNQAEAISTPDPDGLVIANLIDTINPRPPPANDEIELLFRLDSWINPGLTVAEFRTLFARCSECLLYMTRKTVLEHKCKEEGT